MDILKISVTLFCLLCCNCLKNQQHEITQPETPVYTLSGIVRDIDGKEPLVGIKVFLDSIDDYILTDSLGFYKFERMVTVKDHSLNVKRDGYFVVKEKSIVMSYSDRTIDLEAPKPLIGKVGACFNSARKSGLCWNNQTMAVLEGIPPTEENPFYYLTIYKTDDLENYKDHWSLTQSFDEDFTANGIINCQGSYWFLMTGLFKSVLYEITNNGKFSTTITLPFYATDITWDGSNFWVASGRSKMMKLVNWGNQVENYFVSGSGTHGIAWDGKHFWTTDIDDNYVCKYDSNFEISATYVPFVDNQEFVCPIIDRLTHIAFDAAGDLWGIDARSGTEYIFKFDL